MPPLSALRTALVLSISLISICSCADLHDQLRTAGAEKGRTSAGVDLPDLPADCWVKEPHAPLSVGEEARVAIRMERKATDRANARVGRCAGFYDDLRVGLSGAKP
jgi:hypothetical protein